MRLATLASTAMLLSGCTFHSTDANEVGVLTRKIALIGKPGVQDEIFQPGATYSFMAIVTDWHVFKTNTQNLEMSADPKKGDRKERDDLQFKTHDGNDIAVDVTVTWHIDQSKAPHLLKYVAGSTEEVKERLVRTLSRSMVRDVLGTMTSEEFYVAQKRFQKAEEAHEKLNAATAPEGVLIDRVLLNEFHFAKKYEEVIHDRVLADQTAQRMVSEGNAALQDSLSKLATAKGQVEQKIARANGTLAQARLESDAELYRQKSVAEAVRAEKAAKAQGIRKQNEAMGGVGGRTLVKLKIAEALEGKQIIFMPGGGKAGALQTMNINDLLSRYAGAQAVERESKESKEEK